MRIKRIYNHKKDILDGTEQKFGIKYFSSIELPETFDLRKNNDYVPPILDQSDLQSCTANEISNSLRYCIGKENGVKNAWQPSRLYIYYFTRFLENSPLDQDIGMSIKGGMDCISKYGVCDEIYWPYIISRFSVQLPVEIINKAKIHIDGFQFYSILQDIIHIKQALFSGYPILIGIQIYSSFESDIVYHTGIVQIPSENEEYLGSHCVQIWGYDDNFQIFICSNVWSTKWGQNGYFTIPYKYILDSTLASDLWQVTYFK